MSGGRAMGVPALDGRRLALVSVPLVAAAAVLLGGAAVANLPAFLAAWLPACLFVFDVALGALLLRLIHQLSGGAWGAAAEPALKALAGMLPAAVVLFLPLLWGSALLFDWLVEPVPALESYLDGVFLTARTLGYFVVWLLLAALLRTWQAASSEPRPAVAAGGLVLYVPSVTFFAIDWIVTLQLPWYSAAIGFVVISGQAVAGLAATILLLVAGRRARPAPDTLHDFGNLLLAAVMLWAWLTFMQYLIIWSADLPHETGWYRVRRDGFWPLLGALMVALQFVVPFTALLFRRIKRQPRALAAVAAVALLGHLLQLWWMVTPAQGGTLTWLDVAAVLCVGASSGLVVSLLLRNQAVSGAPP